MENNLRDRLIEQILEDAENGDTTVLSELLDKFDDTMVYGVLNDVNQCSTEKPIGYGLKTLYYTEEVDLQDSGDDNVNVKETTGYKTISIYDIVNGKPSLLTSINAGIEYSSIDEIEFWLEHTTSEVFEEDGYYPIDLENTFIFEKL